MATDTVRDAVHAPAPGDLLEVPRREPDVRRIRRVVRTRLRPALVRTVPGTHDHRVRRGRPRRPRGGAQRQPHVRRAPPVALAHRQRVARGGHRRRRDVDDVEHQIGVPAGRSAQPRRRHRTCRAARCSATAGARAGWRPPTPPPARTAAPPAPTTHGSAAPDALRTRSMRRSATSAPGTSGLELDPRAGRHGPAAGRGEPRAPVRRRDGVRVRRHVHVRGRPSRGSSCGARRSRRNRRTPLP